MTVKLVMLKSGEDIIADVKEIKSEEDVIGYFFHDPLIVKMYSPEEPVVLSEENGVESEHGTTKEISSKIGITFWCKGSIINFRVYFCTTTIIIFKFFIL